MIRGCAFTLCMLLASLPSLGVDAEIFQWASPVQRGSQVEIRGIYGDVRAETASGRQVEVVAAKRGIFDDASGVEVRVLEHPRGYTICAVYPSRPDDCVPGAESPIAGNNDVRVDFTVRVPEGVRLLARTVNGEVEMRGLRSDVEAYTVNGGVKISTSGSARARTVNGRIEAAFAKRAPTAGELSTVNGEIDVHLPPDASANLRARTSNGSVNTDFPIAAAAPEPGAGVPLTGQDVQGRIGRGGSSLRLLTVNGSISLKKQTPGVPASLGLTEWD